MGVLIVGEVMCVVGGWGRHGVHGNSLYLPLSFVGNLKLLHKIKSVILKKIMWLHRSPVLISNSELTEQSFVY